MGPPARRPPQGSRLLRLPPSPPTRLQSPRPLSPPQSLRPYSPQPPPPQPPVQPRPDSPPLAKPDRAEPAADTRNEPPRPRPRLTLTGFPSQSTPTCPHPLPILGPELQTGALFGQWQQDVGLLGKSRPHLGWADRKTNQKAEFGLTDKANGELKPEDLCDIFFRLSPLFFFSFYFFGRSRKLRANPACKAGREGGMKEPITSRGPRTEQPILGLKMKWVGTGAR